MELAKKITFLCYVIIFGYALGMGLLYSFYPKIMFYHEAVIGVPWEQMNIRFQDMFLALFHTTGVSQLGIGTAGFIILLIPFRKGEKWTLWALPLIYFPSCLYLTYITIYLHHAHHAPTPWLLNLVFQSVFIIAVILSFILGKKE